MAYYDFLNIVFAPLLKLPPVWAVIIISFIVSIIITVATKYLTNQELMKKLKEDTKQLQSQLKESKNNPQKMVELQKKQMEMTMEQFKHSLKPTLITFIPIIIIFTWMGSVFAYENIRPQQEFSVYAAFDDSVSGNAQIEVPDELQVIGDKNASIVPAVINKKSYPKSAKWILKGNEGGHTIEVSYKDEAQQHIVLITNENKYTQPSEFDGNIKSIGVEYKKRILIPVGIRDWLGWLGTYILSSLIFTMALRKAFKIY
ncbi:DUF106 domain-containing protein [Candidatus Woesearchaeota archaeon]|nr:DUF106 domain-containing protein [Candidatus Woesearchaeota archaeon]